MTRKAIFYHAGCPVCVAAEDRITEIIDRSRIDLEIVHLGDAPGRIDEAEAAGVRSVPALVVDGAALHINHGADLAALR
ncbi:thioredoxin family protein [Marinicauda algicola]|uniref:Thioredoxin family protein n=1 Tax=Marinicauda algicola TaxID=2029849 RepID=A0A4S2H5L2_9PROT|nr:thioredoxin family protein [Marinicauda algicola]TGY90691.1 thioredoxin family protein [Marinicauda algicola]